MTNIPTPPMRAFYQQGYADAIANNSSDIKLRELVAKWLAVSEEYNSLGMVSVAGILYDAARELEAILDAH